MKECLRIVKVRNVKTPCYGSKGAAGLDFFIPNDFNNGKIYHLGPGKDIKILSGIKVNIPEHTCLLAVNKSGVCLNQKLQVGACLIDYDYIGEISLHVFNFSNECKKIIPGQKLIQFIHMPYFKSNLMIENSCDNWPMTDRNNRGFGNGSGLF